MWICGWPRFSIATPFGSDSQSVLVRGQLCRDEFNFNSQFSSKDLTRWGNHGRLSSGTTLLRKWNWWPFRVFCFLGRDRFEVFSALRVSRKNRWFAADSRRRWESPSLNSINARGCDNSVRIAGQQRPRKMQNHCKRKKNNPQSSYGDYRGEEHPRGRNCP